MASNRVLAKSINMPFLQSNNKFIYVSLLVVLSFFLLLDYVPGMHAYSAWVTPPLALFLGLAFALLCGQAHPKFNKKTSKYLLQYSVVGLGFGMNLQASLASGKEGMEFTIISVVGTLLIGWLIGRKFLKVDRDTSYLISSGTAICGGSAIAAVGPVLKAKDSEMSVALGTIFILNAIALFVFPMIGHALNMTENQYSLVHLLLCAGYDFQYLCAGDYRNGCHDWGGNQFFGPQDADYHSVLYRCLSVT